MSQIERVLLDSNIPMYAAGSEHPYRAPCQEILRRAVGGELQAVTSVEVHQELLHRYLALGLHEKAREISEDFELAVPDILGLSMDDLRIARGLSARYPRLPARDLLHVAVMLNNGVRDIASADHHFDAVSEIRRLDPIQWTTDHSTDSP